MSELLNFPFVNQRTDGDVNHDYDCVPSSLQAGANYLLAGHDSINGAAMKDAVYGRGYVGGTAASAFVAYLQARGVRIYPIDGGYPSLLIQAHFHLSMGRPVIFTRDDPYSSNPGDSHVSVWYKDGPSSLTAMDPFGAQAITMSDAEWSTHLRANEFWIMERTSMTPTGWKDDGQTLTDPNGKTLTGAIRTTILASNWQPGDVLVDALRFDQPGQSVLLEDGRWGNGDLILFQSSSIAVAWKPDPALTGGVQQTNVTFVVPTGNELLWARREIATLKAAPAPAPAPQPANVVDAVSKLQGALKDLGA